MVTPTVLPPANGWVTVYPLPGSAEVVFDDNNVAGVFNASNQLLSYGTAGIYPYGTVNGGTIVDTGSYTYPFGTILTWGRWTGPHAGCHQQRHDANQRTGIVRHGHGPELKIRSRFLSAASPPIPTWAARNRLTLAAMSERLRATRWYWTSPINKPPLTWVSISQSIGANFTVAGIGTKTNQPQPYR